MLMTVQAYPPKKKKTTTTTTKNRNHSVTLSTSIKLINIAFHNVNCSTQQRLTIYCLHSTVQYVMNVKVRGAIICRATTNTCQLIHAVSSDHSGWDITSCCHKLLITKQFPQSCLFLFFHFVYFILYWFSLALM